MAEWDEELRQAWNNAVGRYPGNTGWRRYAAEVFAAPPEMAANVLAAGYDAVGNYVDVATSTCNVMRNGVGLKPLPRYEHRNVSGLYKNFENAYKNDEMGSAMLETAGNAVFGIPNLIGTVDKYGWDSPEATNAASHSLFSVFALKTGRPVFRASAATDAAAAAGAQGRHWTSAQNLQTIQQQQVINPSARSGCVDVEVGPPFARFKATGPKSARAQLGAASSEGYVQFDISSLPVRNTTAMVTNYEGVQSASLTNFSLDISMLNPKYVNLRTQWWQLWRPRTAPQE
jgi:hypothetical protein